MVSMLSITLSSQIYTARGSEFKRSFSCHMLRKISVDSFQIKKKTTEKLIYFVIVRRSMCLLDMMFTMAKDMINDIIVLKFRIELFGASIMIVIEDYLMWFQHISSIEPILLYQIHEFWEISH